MSGRVARPEVLGTPSAARRGQRVGKVGPRPGRVRALCVLDVPPRRRGHEHPPREAEVAALRDALERGRVGHHEHPPLAAPVDVPREAPRVARGAVQVRAVLSPGARRRVERTVVLPLRCGFRGGAGREQAAITPRERRDRRLVLRSDAGRVVGAGGAASLPRARAP